MSYLMNDDQHFAFYQNEENYFCLFDSDFRHNLNSSFLHYANKRQQRTICQCLVWKLQAIFFWWWILCGFLCLSFKIMLCKWTTTSSKMATGLVKTTVIVRRILSSLQNFISRRAWSNHQNGRINSIIMKCIKSTKLCVGLKLGAAFVWLLSVW